MQPSDVQSVVKDHAHASQTPLPSPSELADRVDDYLRHAGLDVVPAHEAETLPMVISLALATGSVTLLPAYMKRLLPPSVVARPLAGRTPTIPLALAHNKANPSPLLRHLLSRSEAFMAAA